MEFLPVGLRVRGQSCVVVGGGEIGARKAATLNEAGALVTVVSPEITNVLAELVELGEVRWIQCEYSDDHLSGAFLVVAATNDPGLNAGIVDRASETGSLVCDASSSERTQVIFGALHKGEDGVNVAVFTDGKDPSKARRSRDRIAAFLKQDRTD